MIEAWFPTLIYRNNLGPVMNNEALYKKALELKKSKPGHNWDSGVYNSLDAVDIRNDPHVKEFITVAKSHAHQFLTEIGGKKYKGIECRDCWFNVYEKGDYQEIHTHANSHLSVVYYISVPENSGQIIFSNPTYFSESMPIDDNSGSTRYTPGDSDILIFKSNLAHRVSRSQSVQLRVSLALNFLLTY